MKKHIENTFEFQAHMATRLCGLLRSGYIPMKYRDSGDSNAQYLAVMRDLLENIPWKEIFSVEFGGQGFVQEQIDIMDREELDTYGRLV